MKIIEKGLIENQLPNSSIQLQLIRHVAAFCFCLLEKLSGIPAQRLFVQNLNTRQLGGKKLEVFYNLKVLFDGKFWELGFPKN